MVVLYSDWKSHFCRVPHQDALVNTFTLLLRFAFLRLASTNTQDWYPLLQLRCSFTAPWLSQSFNLSDMHVIFHPGECPVLTKCEAATIFSQYASLIAKGRLANLICKKFFHLLLLLFAWMKYIQLHNLEESLLRNFLFYKYPFGLFSSTVYILLIWITFIFRNTCPILWSITLHIKRSWHFCREPLRARAECSGRCKSSSISETGLPVGWNWYQEV